MSNLAIDSFQRPDSASSFGVASDGQTWVRDAGIGVSAIVSNQGRVGPGGNDSHFLIGSGTASTVNLLCRVKSDSSGNVAAVLFRYSSQSGTNNNGYRIGLFSSTLMADKYTNGVRTGIGSYATSYVIGEEWWVRAIAVGSSITGTAWKDGTTEPAPQLSLTDSGFASGQYGISVHMAAGFTYFDSLTITDNQSGPTGVQGGIEAVWATRDGTSTWTTRSNAATWKTRDNTVTWITRKV